MPKAERDLTQAKIRLSRSHHDRLRHHSKRTGRDMADIMREAIEGHIEVLDEKEKFAKHTRGRGLAYVPDHAKPQGLGPMYSPPSATKPSATPTASPFDILKSKPFAVPDKVRRAFRHWAEFLEQADGIVESQQRAKTIIDDIKQRVEEKDVQPCYEAFVDFCAARKDSREKPLSLAPDIPMVGDV